MEEFIISNGSDLLLNQNYNQLYANKVNHKEFDSLFKNTFQILHTHEDDESYLFDELELGGASSRSKTNETPYLRIMPSFINVVKGRIIYQGKTKLSLEKIKPTNKRDPVLLGTILELSKVKSVLNKTNLTKKDLEEFIKSYDIAPLMYNSSDLKDKEIVFRNKKKMFFHRESKLCFVTFELQDVSSFYAEVPSKEVKITFEKIEDVIKDKDYIVAHYIYDNFFFLVPTTKLKLHSCYLINIGPDENVFEFKEVKNFNYEPNQRKINLTEIDGIVSKARTYLSSFT